jgi:hypothetical protein
MENRCWGRLISGRGVFDSSSQWEKDQFRREQQQRQHDGSAFVDEDVPGPTDDDAPDAELTARDILTQAGMISAAELDRKIFPPKQWHVPGLIGEGFGLIVAPPEAGKSWLVAATGLACASGGKAFGYIDVHQRPVLYMALEDGEQRLQERHRLLLGAEADKPENMHVIVSATPLTAPHIIAAFMQLYGADHPLVIVDTMVKIRPARRPGDDPYQFDYTFASGLKAQLHGRPGAGLWAVHHSRKATAEDFVDAVSGTNGLAGAADHILVLKHPRLSAQASLLVTSRDVAEGEYALISDQGHGWRLDGDTLDTAAATARTRQQQARLGDRSAELVKFFNDCGTRAASPATAAEATGIPSEQVYSYLGRLVESGTLVKTGRGLYMNAVGCVGSVGKHAESEPEPNTSNTTNTYRYGGRAFHEPEVATGFGWDCVADLRFVRCLVRMCSHENDVLLPSAVGRST